MIVCICKNISNTVISEDIINGLTIDEIIHKYDCTDCESCHYYIEEMIKTTVDLN